MTKLLSFLALAAASTAGASSSVTVAPPWLAVASAPGAVALATAPRDSADALWRRAREAISDGDYARAAELFGKLRSQFPTSTYTGDSYYWQAFALSRGGSSAELRRALDLLNTQGQKYAAAGTAKTGEARTLATRIRGILARGGDADAAAVVVGAAALAAKATSAVSAASAVTAASAASMASAASAVEAAAPALGRCGAYAWPGRPRQCPARLQGRG